MIRLLFLLGALAAPFLSAPWSVLALAAALLAWLRTRPVRQETLVVVLFLGLAAAALGLRWTAERGAQAPEGEQIAAARKQYARLWDGLQREAAETAVALREPPRDRQSTLEAFRLLAEIEPASGRGRRSLLLVDADGVAVAWSGEGLLHEFPADQMPRSGLHYKASFRAVTLLAVEPLDGSRRPWRVVAGSSFPTYTLPFPADISIRRWTLVDRAEQARPGTLLVPLAGAPTLVLARLPPGASPSWPWVPHLAWGSIAFALLALAVLRAVGMVLPLDAPPSPPSESRWWTFLFFISGVFAAGRAAELAPVHLGILVAGVGLAVWGLFGRPAGPPPRTWVVAARGAGVILVLSGIAWGAQWGRPPIDLAAGLAPGAAVLGLRIAFAALALGLLVLSGRRAGTEAPPGEKWTWGACAALLAGAAFCDVRPSPCRSSPRQARGSPSTPTVSGWSGASRWWCWWSFRPSSPRLSGRRPFACACEPMRAKRFCRTWRLPLRRRSARSAARSTSTSRHTTSPSWCHDRRPAWNGRTWRMRSGAARPWRGRRLCRRSWWRPATAWRRPPSRSACR